ncbi:MAG: PEP-CTERM sorting domain-containing protein [Acidobacteria bacterium]|nr:PEP-CTERM sorting domain-containing protein [Acidobacteriota bacterium]
MAGPPISGNIAVAQFIMFANGITFDLTKVLPGTGPICDISLGNNPGYVCTPTINGLLSPFTLQNSSAGSGGTATNAAVTFNIEALAYSGLASTGTSTYNGAFSTQSAGQNIAGILSTVATPGGTVIASYSANFNGASNTQVPEPGTLGTLGIGLAALILGGIRKKSASVR